MKTGRDSRLLEMAGTGFCVSCLLVAFSIELTAEGADEIGLTLLANIPGSRRPVAPPPQPPPEQPEGTEPATDQPEAGRGAEAPPTFSAAVESRLPAVAGITNHESRITFRLDNSPVSEVLRIYAEMTGRTVIHSPSIANVANISIDVKTPLTTEEALLTIESLLYAHGVSLTPMGEKLVKATTVQAMQREGVPLSRLKSEELPEGDRLTAQLIPLEHLDVADAGLVQNLSQFIHQPGGSIVPIPRANSLLVIDTAMNVKRVMEIIETIDQPSDEEQVEVKYYELNNSTVAAIAGALGTMIGSFGSSQESGVRSRRVCRQ